MPLRVWMHRAANSAKHKTAECLSLVHGHSGSHLELGMGESSQASSQNDRTEVASSTVSPGRKFDNATFADKASDNEGYVTANDGREEFEDRTSENQSDGVGDEDRRHVNGMHDSSRNGLHNSLQPESLQPESRKIQDEGEGLSSSQLQAINELRMRVLRLESDERLKKVEDATLLRFLVARQMDVAEASEMFIKDWRWRNEIAPCVTKDGISHQLKAEKTFLQGIDRTGRPLVIVLGSKHFAKKRDMEEFERYCFYCIEKVISCIPEGKEEFVAIFDLGGIAYRNIDTSATLMMVELLQAHYPERMGRLFALHVSTMIHMPYKIVEPAIDMKTRQKITFVDDEDLDSLLKAEIGEECVPREYGGKAEFIPIQYAQIDRRTSFPITAVRSQ